MTQNRLFSALAFALVTLLAAGCCKPCTPTDYGTFPTRDASKSWVAYANSQVLQRTFRNKDSLDRTYVYDYLETGINPGIALNCVDRGACGLCCDQYAEGYLFTRLSDGGYVNFSIAVTKDFSQHTVSDSASLVPDMVEITFANNTPTQIRMGTTAPTYPTLKIHGRTFANVYQWGTPADPITPIPAAVSAFYFTEKEGIVGYVTGQGLLYGLVRQ